jgi:SAM-dependent methyltransferase
MIAQTRNPTCPLCESNSTQPRPGYEHIEPGNWTLYKCLACATSFLHPMPDSAAMATFYGEDYYGRAGKKFVGPVEGIIRSFRYMRAKTLHRLKPAGRILDVGCGRGLMLMYLKDWGYEVDGVELDPLAAERAQKNLKQEIFLSLDRTAHILRHQYGAICFWHSLEHLQNPGNALRTADRLLAPGGVLVIAAPHMESLQSHLAGQHWLHLDLPRHLVHFDMMRLAAFLQGRGYDIVRHDHFSQEYNVIDTLCYLYATLGFDHLYPFNLIRGQYRRKERKDTHGLKTFIGLALLLPLGASAFFLANFFSLIRSGGTTTLILRKTDGFETQLDRRTQNRGDANGA